jgi:hypothetical protein
VEALGVGKKKKKKKKWKVEGKKKGGIAAGGVGAYADSLRL